VCNHSLIEDVEELASYATHPVVHQKAYHYQGKCSARTTTLLVKGEEESAHSTTLQATVSNSAEHLAERLG
jgi:hypothetical protein